MEWMLTWISRYGYAAITGLLAASIVVPVPDDALLLVAGSLVYRGELAYVPTIAAGALGATGGMTVSYGLGRWLGVRLIRRFGPLVHLDAARFEASRAWYLRWGKLSVLFGYFVPGLRHVAAFVAGSSGLSWAQFAALGYSGGLVWASAVVTLGYYLGAEWAHVSARIHRTLLGALAVAVPVVLVASTVIRHQRRARGPSSARVASDPSGREEPGIPGSPGRRDEGMQ